MKHRVIFWPSLAAAMEYALRSDWVASAVASDGFLRRYRDHEWFVEHVTITGSGSPSAALNQPSTASGEALISDEIAVIFEFLYEYLPEAVIQNDRSLARNLVYTSACLTMIGVGAGYAPLAMKKWLSYPARHDAMLRSKILAIANLLVHDSELLGPDLRYLHSNAILASFLFREISRSVGPSNADKVLDSEAFVAQLHNSDLWDQYVQVRGMSLFDC